MTLLAIDNFLLYPKVVRDWALSQEFYTDKELSEKFKTSNTFPGKRTIQVHELDIQFANTVLDKVANIVKHNFGLNHDLEIASSFQLTVKSDSSWIHKDDNVLVAGVLYLTPDAPVNSGTIIYTEPPHKVKDIIGNVFNRLILYNANEYHKSAKYFGQDNLNCRLTQVFFIK